jgi:hypothetical protein
MTTSHAALSRAELAKVFFFQTRTSLEAAAGISGKRRVLTLMVQLWPSHSLVQAH